MGAVGSQVLLAGAAVLIALLAVYYAGNKHGATGLPFNGQFPVATIRGNDFRQSVGIPPRNPASNQRDYGLFLLFNTVDKCPSCGEFDEIFASIASRVSGEERLKKRIHFARILLDANTREIFAMSGIQQLPALFYLPATNNDTRDYEQRIRIYDLGSGANPEIIAGFINHCGALAIKVGIESYYGIMICSVVLLALVVLFVSPAVLTQILLISFVLLMTSGAMWVRIRDAPFRTRDGSKYIADGIQSQFGAEVLASVVLNGAAFLALLSVGSNDIKSRALRRISLFLSMGIVVFAMGIQIAIFKAKLPSYPFRLIF